MDDIRVSELNIISHIYKELAYLNPALRRVAEYILEHPDECKTITIQELASLCDVAESTVTRFVKEIGLNNYQTLKIGLAEALSSSDTSSLQTEENNIYEDISRHDSISNILDKVTYRNIQTLNETKQRINIEELEKAVQAIEQAETLLFVCIGSSSVAGEEAVMRFTRAGKKCIIFKDEALKLMSAAIATPKDVVIGISNSGESVTVVHSLKTAHANGVRTIGITSFEDSSMVRYSDIALFTPTKIPAHSSGLYWEATTSKTAQIMLIDIIYACYAVKTFDATLKALEDTYLAARDTRGRSSSIRYESSRFNQR